MELPFDCGCDNRRDVMGAGEWHLDAQILVGAVIVAVFVFLLTR